MSNFDKDKLKEKLLHEAKTNKPDLWNKIESQLPSNKIEPPTQKTKSKFYIKTFSNVAAVLALIVGISI